MRLTQAAKLAIQGEGKDAKAAEKLGINLLLWYIGARFPTKSERTQTGRSDASREVVVAGHPRRGAINGARGPP
jgi:hypothetical protein